MDNLRVEHTDTSITVQTDRFGSLGDFAAFIQEKVELMKPGRRPATARGKDTSKSLKR